MTNREFDFVVLVHLLNCDEISIIPLDNNIYIALTCSNFELYKHLILYLQDEKISFISRLFEGSIWFLHFEYSDLHFNNLNQKFILNKKQYEALN